MLFVCWILCPVCYLQLFDIYCCIAAAVVVVCNCCVWCMSINTLPQPLPLQKPIQLQVALIEAVPVFATETYPGIALESVSHTATEAVNHIAHIPETAHITAATTAPILETSRIAALDTEAPSSLISVLEATN